MKISCRDLDQFMNVVEALVHRGIGFRADADTLIILVNGAF